MKHNKQLYDEYRPSNSVQPNNTQHVRIGSIELINSFDFGRDIYGKIRSISHKGNLLYVFGEHHILLEYNIETIKNRLQPQLLNKLTISANGVMFIHDQIVAFDDSSWIKIYQNNTTSSFPLKFVPGGIAVNENYIFIYFGKYNRKFNTDSFNEVLHYPTTLSKESLSVLKDVFYTQGTKFVENIFLNSNNILAVGIETPLVINNIEVSSFSYRIWNVKVIDNSFVIECIYESPEQLSFTHIKTALNNNNTLVAIDNSGYCYIHENVFLKDVQKLKIRLQSQVHHALLTDDNYLLLLVGESIVEVYKLNFVQSRVFFDIVSQLNTQYFNFPTSRNGFVFPNLTGTVVEDGALFAVGVTEDVYKSERPIVIRFKDITKAHVFGFGFLPSMFCSYASSATNWNNDTPIIVLKRSEHFPLVETGKVIFQCINKELIVSISDKNGNITKRLTIATATPLYPAIVVQLKRLNFMSQRISVIVE